MTALHHKGSLGKVAVGAIGTGAHEHLLNDRMLLKRPHRYNIIRLVRERNEWFKSTHIKSHLLIIFRIGIREKRLILVSAILRFHKFLYNLICRKDGACRTHFRTHIGNGQPLRNRKRLYALADIFKNLAETTLDRHAAKHLQHDLLGIDSGS